MKRNFQRGSVTIFLIIILVPCIVVSSIFVDLSRVRLSRSVAVSSADLALNSLLSYYDKDLSQFYGMMASCQNIEDFYEESAQFFLDAIHSQGLSDDDVNSLIDLYSVAVGDDTIYDLLQMDVKTEPSAMISEVEGANLGESSILIKDQVVDFMKYRGPVEITTGIIQRLKENNASSQTRDASKNEKLVKKKQDYADKEGDLLDACYNSYVQLKKYEEKEKQLEDLSTIANNINGYKETYKEINRKLVVMVGASEVKEFKRPAYSLNEPEFENSYKKRNGKPKTSVYSKKETVDGKETYYVNATKIEAAKDDLETKKEEFVQAKNNVINAAGSLINETTGSGNGDANEIRWWLAVNKAVNTGNNSAIQKYQSKAESMLKAYSKMVFMLGCEKEEDVTDTLLSECDKLQETVVNLQEKYLKSGIKGDDKYLMLVNQMEKTSTTIKNTINNNKSNIASSVQSISSDLDDYKTTLSACVELLQTVIGGDFLKGIKSLDSLKNLVKNYDKALDNWESQAERKDTSMATEDLEEINEAREKFDEVTVEEVEKLKVRLGNIKGEMEKVIRTIDGLKYCGKKLIDIKSYDDAYAAINNNNRVTESDIPLRNGEISSYADTMFESESKPLYKNESPLSLQSGNAYNPDLSVDTPNLYKYWDTQFNGVNPKELDEKKKEVNDNKNAGKEEKKKLENSDNHAGRTTEISKTNLYGNENYNASDFPSGLDEESPFKLGSSFLSSIGNIAKSLENLENGGLVDNVRDSIYTTEYVMDMFSYATYANEGRYHLYREKNPDTAIPDNPDYSSVEGSADAEGTWKSELITDTYNKTLTNRSISATNNIAYGAEAEYILYGNTNVKNVCSAYADIFTIRYALNLVSGFQHFWSGNNQTSRTINNTANLIAQTTQGIIPAVVSKSVMITLLTVFETGRDLDRLQNGLPVEVYKEEKNWRISLDGWNRTDNSESEKNNIKGLFYSDYLYLFLYLGFSGNSAEEMYLRLADVIQANMRQAIGSDSYMMKNARAYFKLEAKIRVKPLMLTIPYAIPYSNNPKDKEDWCTFEISQIRGYS